MRQRKTHYATHFGPEPEPDTVKINKKKEKTSYIKESLLIQMKNQEQSQRSQIEMDRAFENLVVDANNQKMQEEEQRAKGKIIDQKKYFKEIWEEQMRINQDKGKVIA